jgi:spore coat polysaccharide biosynthesis protein SpsF
MGRRHVVAVRTAVRTVAILQARTTSARLPGKVLMDVAGAPLLAQELRRLLRAGRLDEVVVATTTNESDDPVVDLARREGVRWFRGDERDVLSRYVGAAAEARAEAVVRVTADCPLLDPDVVDRVVSALGPAVDYASNVVERTFPVGLDAEALHHDVLLRVDRLAHSDSAREHVTWFVLEERPDLFAIASVTDDEDNSDLRWTVDHAEDLDVVRRLYAELDLAETPRAYREVVAHVRAGVR